MKRILITGRPRVGKTTLIKHCAHLLGNKAGGFFTEEIYGEGVRGRRGFQLVTLDGQLAMLAEVDRESSYHVGRYGVNLDVMERLAVPAIMNAVEDPSKSWILIDEIGKMEEGCTSFKEAVSAALSSSKNFLATIRWHDDEFTQQIKKRKGIEIIKLTVPTREDVYQKISKILRD